jgi:threonine aldolase
MSAPSLQLDFGSENTSPVHPAFVTAVAGANVGFATNFEAEAWTERALRSLREFFEHDGLQAFTVSTGTAANAIAIGAMVPPYGTVLCHWDAHIETDECGAPEMFSFGARQIPLAGEHGRLSPAAVARHLSHARIGVVHSLQPAVLSLTNLTEAGTAYTPAQIKELTDVVRPYGLGVHMDGARFANAAATVGATPAELSWKSGVDVLTLGTTKSGSLGVETIVCFNEKFNTPLAFLRKRSGHLAPKTRFLAAQLQAYMDDQLWLKNARHANSMARSLAEGLAALPGVELVHPVEGNEVFVQMPESMARALFQQGVRFQLGWRPEPLHHRFVCSWATSLEQVRRVIAIASQNVYATRSVHPEAPHAS